MYNRDGKVMEWTFEIIVPIDEFILTHKFRLRKLTRSKLGFD